MSFFGRLFGTRPDSLAVLRKIKNDAWWANFALICAENGEKELAKKIVEARKQRQ
jgi:hypothetical protein